MQTGVQEEAANCDFSTNATESGDDDFPKYETDTNRRGIIINNCTKTPENERRLKIVKEMFDELKFKACDFRENLTVKQMEEFLEEVSKEMTKNKDVVSCLGCVVLGYGDHGFVNDANGEAVNINDVIMDPFKDKCEALIGKPKLFFIQTSDSPGDSKTKSESESEGKLEAQINIPVEADLLLVQSFVDEITPELDFVGVLSSTIRESKKDLLTTLSGDLSQKIIGAEPSSLLPYISSTLRKEVYL